MFKDIKFDDEFIIDGNRIVLITRIKWDKNEYDEYIKNLKDKIPLKLFKSVEDIYTYESLSGIIEFLVLDKVTSTLSVAKKLNADIVQNQIEGIEKGYIYCYISYEFKNEKVLNKFTEELLNIC